jgi:peptide/nickel transport system substrate-binding protein
MGNHIDMRFFFLILCMVFSALAGCRRGQPEPAADRVVGDTILMGTIGDASNLLPVLASDSASSDVSGLVYNGLVRYDKNLQLEGELAESWSVSPDNRTITFHLRRGVKWHDGAPFTSADVLFTYRLLVDPKVPTA